MDLKNALQTHKPGQKFKNVSEVGKVELAEVQDVELIEKEFDGKIKKRYKATYNKEEIFIPVSVMNYLKATEEEVGDRLIAFKVNKKGSGLDTEYTVIPEILPETVNM